MTAIVVLRMGEVLETKISLRPVLGPIMIRIEHGTLTKFFRIKPFPFIIFETDDAFEFIIGCYKRLHNMGIVEKQNF